MEDEQRETTRPQMPTWIPEWIRPVSPRRPRSPSSMLSSNWSSRSSSVSGSAFDVPSSPYNENENISSSSLKFFTFNELIQATENFRHFDGNRNGYVGWINEQPLLSSQSARQVLVKELPDNFIGNKEWLAKVNCLSQLHHPNLVKLIGKCSDDDRRFLIFEFMPNGSLERSLLRGSPETRVWSARIKAAIGAAKGLSFLHENQIIHRDVRAGNIFLDSEHNGKLLYYSFPCTTDKTACRHVSWPMRMRSAIEYVKDVSFDSAMQFTLRDTEALDILLDPVISYEESAGSRGLSGYVAPEYSAEDIVSIKSDVYSFGVILLELLSGRFVTVTNRCIVDRDLVLWAKKFLGSKRKFFRIMDQKFEGKYPAKRAFLVGQLALQCLNIAPSLRPSMHEVLAVLEKNWI